MKTYTPILNEKSQKTKTFQIASLFYIALFGGVYALTILGLTNSRMLQIKGIKFWGLALISLLFMIAKISFGLLDMHFVFQIHSELRFTLFKLTDLLLFLVYYHTLKVPYRLHMIYHAEYRHMSYRGMAVFVCLFSIILDLVTNMSLYK